ncbi:MAG TPA: saccharopine dehydrogenase NADP-binding domain-containing protein, partial [Pyrinomonadaceae bacterium]|nr:saccharopine dehydrogenase NADP-binding domain-containing protein [Pyrinomonadaceae bacterium]
MKKKIFIAGSGGIGEAAALLLREWADFEIELCLGDISPENLESARHFVTDGSSKTSAVETVLMEREGVSDAMRSAFGACDCLLDCSPGGQAPKMAGFAKEFGMHYANLTEYVAETDKIIDLANDASTGFVLQTGL